MELGQVEAFVEAQRRGSITRAAEALDLTQPTLTARLRGLEREVGAQLLVRGRRGVALTPAGRRFLPRAAMALDALRRAAADARAASEGRGGRFAVGLASDVAVYLAPAALARFARSHPEVEISVVSGRSPFVADALRSEQVEIAIVSQLMAYPDIASRPLFSERVPVVVGRRHPLARRGRAKLADIAREGIVLRDSASYLYALTTSYFAAAGVAPRVLMQLDSTEACKRVVLAGLGAALLPEMAVREERGRGEVVALTVEGAPAPTRTIHVLTRAGAELSVASSSFIGLIEAAGK
ncbi:MAG: LysR family transcriptional regulator [Chloroflexi bacterium]|nr:MAG: LysR family transcriptional regulator [Chloroflexota bacterium]